MKVVKILLSIIALLIIVGVLLPSAAHIERSVLIKASQEEVFNHLNNYQHFNKWSPWHRIDPDTQYQFSGAESGVGAAMSWQSDNDKVGSGSQKIVESIPYESIKVELNFDDMGAAESSYKITPLGDDTQVIWTFDNDVGWNLIGRYFGLFMNKLLGPSYEAGLHNLKDNFER